MRAALESDRAEVVPSIVLNLLLFLQEPEKQPSYSRGAEMPEPCGTALGRSKELLLQPGIGVRTLTFNILCGLLPPLRVTQYSSIIVDGHTVKFHENLD